MVEGGCLCGKVRYAVEGELGTAIVCHCRNCQRQGGSAFSVIAVVPKSQFKLAGEPELYVDTGESGAPVYRHFCSRCGSPLYSALPGSPDVIFVKTGTLDEPQGLTPKLHVWTDSAWAWPGIPADAVTFARNPPSK